MMDLSIILVNWNSADYLAHCLASIYRQVKGPQLEIIVVDNASQDGCEALLRREFSEVKFVPSAENLGFARANNLGASVSSGSALLFLNPDTLILGDSVQSMFNWLSSHPETGAVGVRLLNGDGSLQASCVQSFPTLTNQFLDSEAFRRWFPRWRIWGTQAVSDPERKPANVDAISGACFMVRRGLFERIGGFTDHYFMYSDDLDLSYKIHRSGYSIVCLCSCEVIHYGGASSSQRSANFAAVQQRLAMAQFFRLTRGPVYSMAYRALMSVAAVTRLIVTLIALLFAPSRERREGLMGVLSKWRSVLGWAIGLGVEAN